jgi:predicted amidohydrolase
VRWRNPLVREADAPPPRRVRVVSVMLNPYAPPRDDLAANRRRMLQAAEQAGRYRPDIVCFAETMVNRASGVPLAQAAEPIPGPSTEAFAATARKLRAYIVLSLHEVDDDGYLYNTAVLLDREGKIVGKYRKVHLTMYEWEAGLMPGDDYPVFDTDFGRIGILVCWDYWYPESARLLRLQGAEMVFIPTAGDARIQAAARAVENGMYVIVSGVRQSRILAPNGDVLCETQDPEEDYCVAEIDLNGAYRTHWLSVGPAKGEGRSLYVEERRPDTYGPIGYAARGVRAGGAHTGGAD